MYFIISILLFSIIQPDDCNGSLCEYIGDVYYHFNTNQYYNEEFYYFNENHLNNSEIFNPDNDLLYRNTLDALFVPITSIQNQDTDSLYIYDRNISDYIIISEDNFNGLTNPIELNTVSIQEEDNFTLSTPTSYIINNAIWDFNSARYNVNTQSSYADTITYNYSYNYNENEYSVILDTSLYSINSDIAFFDTTHTISNNHILYDSLFVPSASLFCNQSSEIECNNIEICSWNNSLSECTIYTPPININREYKFSRYTNEFNDNLFFQETTDCNDNYQQDPAELTITDFESSCIESFQLNQDDPCESTCNLNLNMDVWCWNQFSDMQRLTARCVENQGLAFCDTGNNLYDISEFFLDANMDGHYTSAANFQEPYEDRNCNGLWDDNSEVELNNISSQEQCLVESFTTWDYYHEKCFYDTGNGRWDSAEECNNDEFGQSCENYGDAANCDCQYIDLNTTNNTPDNLIINYVNIINPIPELDIVPPDIFKDCGGDGLCDHSEIINGGFDVGTCIPNNYSGSEEDCCKHNFCWDYISSECDFSLIDCTFSSIDDIWTGNLDPAGDNYDPINNPNGTENNFQWDQGEEIYQDFNNSGDYSSGTTYMTKFLPYSECYLNYDPYNENEPPIDSNCGGNTFEIMSSYFEEDTITINIPKLKANNTVESFKLIGQTNIDENETTINFLNKINILKNSTNELDTTSIYNTINQYMVFIDSDYQDNNGINDNIIQLSPLSNLFPSYYEPFTLYSFDTSTIVKDTILYSYDGFIIDNQSYFSFTYHTNDTTSILVTKLYTVDEENVNLAYPLVDPNNEGGNFIYEIENCLKVTTETEYTLLGQGTSHTTIKELYLKDGHTLVKEDISYRYPSMFGGLQTTVPISSIQIKEYIPETYDFGDVNNDNTLDVSDIILIINHIIGNTTLTGESLEQADVVPNGLIDIVDIIALVNIILDN